MSAPTFTTFFIRSVLKELGSDAVVNNGIIDLPFPSIVSRKSSDFARDYLVYNIARKRVMFDKGKEPSSVLKKSIDKWTESERSCGIVNKQGFYTEAGEDEDLFRLINQSAKAHISRILCEFWPDYGSASFTSGATNSKPKTLSKRAAKWLGYVPPERTLSVVPSAKNHLLAILEANPAYCRRLYKQRWRLVDESLIDADLNLSEEAISSFRMDESSIAKLDYVVKDTGSVRIIMMTGEGTMLCQSTFGTMIRHSLAAEGVDLSDQSHNREMALIGSYTGVVATVDLTSASDTVARRTVKTFFPPHVYSWLDSCRDTHVRVGNHVHKLEKFTSMGNGFCFEMESLLFYAMAKAVCDVVGADASLVNVYGDDIIIPSGAYQVLEKYFLHHGLFVNNDKTFAGPQGFRESCGGHYYNGTDVTPFYIGEELTKVTDFIHTANQLYVWSCNTGIQLPNSLAMLVSRIPKQDRVLVPTTYGSKTGLWFYCQDIILPKVKYRKATQAYVTTQSVFRAKTQKSKRWCDRTLLMEWFCNANHRVNVIQSLTWYNFNTYLSRRRVDRSRFQPLTCAIYESSVGEIVDVVKDDTKINDVTWERSTVTMS